MLPRSLLLTAPLILLLSACQQAAWKAGASADDFSRDEQNCRAQTHGDQAATHQCLRDQGWSIAAFSAASGEPAASAASEAATASSTSAPLDTDAKSKQLNSSAAPAPQSADPLQKLSVQTWWKAGAQAADFNRDATLCLQQLGDQHTPDYAQHLYTRAMANCLRTHGWYAGHDPVYTPLR